MKKQKKKKEGLVVFKKPTPFTLKMNGVKYLLVSTGIVDTEETPTRWQHTVKNIEEGHADFGTFYRDVPDEKIKKYL